MTPDTFLDRILWTQLARVVHGSPPEWEPGSASARAIRGVLAATELDPEESGIVERWDVAREASRVLFDRLLRARVNCAVREGLRVEVERLGLKEAPRPPKVLIVREGAPEEELVKTGSQEAISMAPGNAAGRCRPAGNPSFRIESPESPWVALLFADLEYARR